MLSWPKDIAPAAAKLAAQLDYLDLTPTRELSGCSGAQTFLCTPRSHLGRPHPIVVKCGPDALLATDIDGLARARGYFRDADQILSNRVSVDGYTCLPLRLLGPDVEDLKDYLDRPDVTAAQAVAAIDELFTQVIRVPDLTVHLTVANAFSHYVFTDEQTIARALYEVGESTPDLIQWWRHASDTWTAGSAVRLAHGDLHFGNVLRTKNPGRVYVVDFGHTGEHHLFRDLAKLEREIVLTCPGATEKTRSALAHLRSLAQAYAPPGSNFDVEYSVGLMAQFIFAAANPRLGQAKRTRALAEAKTIQAHLVEVNPQPALPDTQVRTARRQEALWRACFIYSRLDQLPGGGWGRSLPDWMEAIWEGNDGMTFRNPDMRVSGGSDLTSYSVMGWAAMMRGVFASGVAARLFLRNQVLISAGRNIVRRVGFQGGTGTAAPSHGHADVRIRHTAMTALALMFYQLGHDHGMSAAGTIADNLRYLLNYLPSWDKDSPHTFGSVMACAKLSELLAAGVANIEDSLQSDVLTMIYRVMPQMLDRLDQEPRNITYRPELQHEECTPRPPFFVPYVSFWRMERSNFLMYVNFAVSTDRQALIEPVGGRLGSRFARCFEELLEEVTAPFDEADPTASLIRYHRGTHAPRDWGLSAELAALLAMPAIHQLLVQTRAGQAVGLAQKFEALREALLATFDRYNDCPDLFRFTHSASFFRALYAFDLAGLSEERVKLLDRAIERLRAAGITELGLTRLMALVMAETFDIDTAGLTSLLVAKLESGEHVGDDHAWERLAAQAEPLATSAGIHDDESSDWNLGWLARRGTAAGRRVLIIAGPGDRAASRLAGQSFEVERIHPNDLAGGDLSRFPAAGSDAVVLGSSLMRFTRRSATRVLGRLVGLMKPGATLFATFTLRDHSLITSSGEFCQYYRDESAVRTLLASTGLSIQRSSTVYAGDRPSITTVHFVCLTADV